MRHGTKYTPELLGSLAAKSRSVTDVLRHLGLKMAGGSHTYISRLLQRFEIDTAHFTGSGWNTGERRTGGPAKLSWGQILIKREKGRRERSFRLRRALLEAGVPYQCAVCSLGDHWQGKELRLQVNHKNLDFLDDRKDNLEFLCPNCHSQTEGWSGQQGGTTLTTEVRWSKKYQNKVAARMV